MKTIDACGKLELIKAEAAGGYGVNFYLVVRSNEDSDEFTVIIATPNQLLAERIFAERVNQR